MQTGQSISEQSNAHSSPYSSHLKDRARKLLLDYHAKTGVRWPTIWREIAELTNIPETDGQYFLSRQSLFRWARGESGLGNERFKYVFRFLTHPQTLQRPEFAQAADLVPDGHIQRLGKAFADFFSHPGGNPYYFPFRPTIFSKSDENSRKGMQAYEGMYVGDLREERHCLSLHQYGNEDFFIAHYLKWRRTKVGNPEDWEIERSSGFCTIGNLIRIHTKGVLVPEAVDHYAVPIISKSGRSKVIVLMVISSNLLLPVINHYARAFPENKDLPAQNIDPNGFTVPLHRSKDEQMRLFIENFKWNIAI